MKMQSTWPNFVNATVWCCVIVTATAAPSRAGDVTWTISTGTANFGGYERSGVGFPYHDYIPQGAGSTSTTVSGVFTTTNTFSSNLDFGPIPVHPINPRATDVDEMGNPKYPGGLTDPQLAIDFNTWLTVTLPPSLAAQNRVTLANSGTYAPGPMPLAITLFSNPLPAAGTGPATFGVYGFDGFGVDPDNPVQHPMSLSGFHFDFYTNKTDTPQVNTNSPWSPENPQYNVEDPQLFATGTPVNLTSGADYGKFASGVASVADFFMLDFHSKDYVASGLGGHWPQTGKNANQAETQSQLTRNGPEYVMILHVRDRFDQAGDIRNPAEADFFDFVFDTTLEITAVANILHGDANFDGTVNIFDINLISSHWSGGVIVGNLTPGDVNGDGIVNIFDINLVSSNWGASGGGGANLGSAAVPEPTGMVLAVVGAALGLFAATRRRVWHR